MSNWPEKILASLQILPHQPGVYKMYDKDGSLLYIGKAKDLFKRVKSYFRDGAKHTVRIQRMLSKVQDLEFTVVDNELEALILETNLIKEHRPYYNILMKDDKNYVYIRVGVRDDFPQISIVRKLKKDGARYFGPKTAAWKVKQTLKLLKKLFPYRHCDLQIRWLNENSDLDKNLEQRVEVTNRVINFPCLDFHIKRCVGPCVGVVTPEEYREMIKRIIAFLEGDISKLVNELKEEMQQLAIDRKFEQAALLRDRLQFLQDLDEKQQISDPDSIEADVINFAVEQGDYFFSLLQVRQGKVIDDQQFILKAELLDPGQGDAEVLEGFITQYYQVSEKVPQQLVIPSLPLNKGLLEDWLKLKAERKVELITPTRGRKYDLLALTARNAKSYANQMQVKWLSEDKRSPQEMVSELKTVLDLPKLPKRIECFDISHLQGTETVGSMVVFENGVSKQADYRHFRIRALGEGEIDDFASMKEVLTRRLKYLLALPKDCRLARLTKKQQSEVAEIKDPKLDLMLENPTALALKKSGKLELIAWLTEEKELKWFWINNKSKIRKDLVFLLLLKNFFNQQKERKIYFDHSFLEETDLNDYDIGAHEDRTKSGRYVLEKYQFSFTDQSLLTKPDLVIIDGGKGQLSASYTVLKNFELQDKIVMVSLAKRLEEIFKPNNKQAVLLPSNHPALFLVQQLRDEAHRFAIKFNRNQRIKKMTSSRLEEIPGVGPKYQKLLLQHFSDIEAISLAEESEIAKITNGRVAKAVKKFLG